MELNLHHRQSEAYVSEATEILYGGAAGGGKSHLMRAAAIFWCSQIAGLQVYIFRRLSDDLLKNHMEGPTGFPALLADLVETGNAKIRHQPTSIEFWNGAKIHLCHCQYEKDMFKYQGAEIHVLMPDELTHFTEKIYRYLRGRCRLGALKVPDQFKGKFPRIVAGTNPGGIGHNWVRATFIDNAPPMAIVQQPKSEGGMKRQYIPARLDDNPTLTETDPDYIDRLEGLGNPALVKAMKDGDWDIVAGGMFDDVWSAKRHVLTPFTIPSSWRIDRSYDWGSSKPFSVGWWAESDGTDAELPDGSKRSFPRGSLFRIAEWYGWNGKPNEGCRMLATEIARGILQREKEMGIAGKVQAGVADSAIFATENGNCIADDMARIGVRWEAADKSPGSRVNGWEMVRKRLKASLESPAEHPGLWVFDTCRHFIRTVPVIPRDDKKPDDVDSDAEDHCFAAGTLVATDRGAVRIEDLIGTVGRVLVDRGTWAPFRNPRLTRSLADVVRVTFSDGATVVCTPAHLFMSASGEWVEARKTTDVISYSAYSTEGATCSRRSFLKRFKNFVEFAITGVAGTSKRKALGCIELSGNARTALSRMAATFITLTMTVATTGLRICGWSAQKITCGTTPPTVGMGEDRSCTQLQQRPRGTLAAPAGTGTGSNTPITAQAHSMSASRKSASNAVSATRQRLARAHEADSAQTIANRQRGVSLAWITLTDAVKVVASRLALTVTGKTSPARRHAAEPLRVVSVEPFGKADVYCMTVPDWGRFALANGAIVHNCADEARYRCAKASSTASFTRLRI